MHHRTVAAIVLSGLAFSLSSVASAAEVSVGFSGVIDFNGAFPEPPNPVGQPVAGLVAFTSPLPVNSTNATTTTYLDNSADLVMSFGAGGSLHSFDANSPLLIGVIDSGGNTVLRVEAWSGASLGTGNKGIVSFTFPGLNAFGPDRALPSGPFTFSQLVAGSEGIGSITIGGGLTSFDVTSIVPEPTSLGLIAMAGSFIRRRR